MVSVFCVVMRFGVNVRVINGRATDDVRMGKEDSICVVTHKERYEKE